MARATGVTCDLDGCGKFITLSGKEVNGQPVGWYRLLLPKTAHDGHGGTTPADDYRDFCAAKCLISFAKERQAIEAPAKGKAQNGQEGHSGGSGRYGQAMDAGLRDWLAEHGYTGSKIGVAFASHTRGQHEERGECRDDCLVCVWLATTEFGSTLPPAASAAA